METTKTTEAAKNPAKPAIRKTDKVIVKAAKNKDAVVETIVKNRKTTVTEPAKPETDKPKALTAKEKAEQKAKLDAEIKAAQKEANDKKEADRKKRLDDKKAAKPVKNTYRKQDACFDAIKIVCKKGATYPEIYTKVSELYKEKTGQTISEKMNMIDYSLYILCSFGIMDKTGKSYKLNKLEGINLNTVFKK